MSEDRSLSYVKAHLSEIVDRVEATQERVTITRNGKSAAVIVHPDDLESLEETLAIMSDPELMAGIREAKKAVAAGDVYSLAEVKKRLNFKD
jgi:prevent-host-death family protein